MVLSGTLTDSSILAAPPFKVKLKRSPMDSGAGLAVAGGRRTKLAASTNGTGSTTTASSPTNAIGVRCDDNVMLTTVQPTTHQRVRCILEERAKWQENGQRRRKTKCANPDVPCSVNNFSIVASKGELSRNQCAPIETPTPGVVVLSKKRSSLANGRSRGKEDTVNGKSGRKSAKDEIGKDSGKDARLRGGKTSLRAISKSASVPANLKEGLPARDRTTHGRTLGRVPEEGILKRSSAFLASLAHPRRDSEDSKSVKSLSTNGYQRATSSRYSTLRGYLSILTGHEEDLRPLKRSPSVQTLPTGWKKKSGAGVKKSVSFSSDTSFEEKRAPFRRQPIHEAKVYCKGVLQDREVRVDTQRAKVPPSWETPSGGPTALLRAAREADDSVLKEVVTRARKLGLGDMDVNLADHSGRTAISYMAGNGAAAMLEVALSFEGVDPNLPDNEGNTPLHFAAQAGQTECLNILLQRCPDIEVDARNTLGFTPLMKAALQGRTKCAKILLFAGANPTLRDHGRGLRAEQWARFCGRYVCAEVIERFARHRLLERTTSCRWGSEPELAAKVLQGKVTPIPPAPLPPPSSGLKSKIRKVFRTTSGPDRSFSLVSQLTSAALCASSPALPKSGDVPPVVKSLLRPLSVPQLRVTLVAPQDFIDKQSEKYGTGYSEKIENTIAKPPRSKKKNK